MNFLFEVLNIHMNEKTITCHDHHGFKWQNINILSVFLYGPTPFLACWIVIAPICFLNIAPLISWIPSLKSL
jgi:hypothetical protein